MAPPVLPLLCDAKPADARSLPQGPLAWGLPRDGQSGPPTGGSGGTRSDAHPGDSALVRLGGPGGRALAGVVRRCREAVPDAALREGRRRARGRGRDDFPVALLGGVARLTPLWRHASYDAGRGAGRRNPALRHLLGVATDDQIPTPCNLSRSLDVLGHPAPLAALRACFDTLVPRPGTVVPDRGRRPAGDATALSARRGDAAPQEAATRRGLPPPAGGRKEYTDDAGKGVQGVEWFGYELHRRVAVRPELVLASRITAPAVGDNQRIAALREPARGNLPTGRIAALASAKAADEEAVHQLRPAAGITPRSEDRARWRSESERRRPGHPGRSHLVSDAAGTVSCSDKVSDPPVRHRMASVGPEAPRGALKYRCPARHEGRTCPRDARCNDGRRYGSVARIKGAGDLRRFPPIPRATQHCERLANGRTAVERVNAR